MAVGGHIGTHSIYLGSDECFEFECNLCRDGTTVKEGIAYCVDCDEYLCKSCLTSHKGIKATKDHNVLQGSNFDNFHKHGGPPQPAREFCEVHKKEIVTGICITHRQIICGECKKSKHWKCADVKPISDVCGKQAASRFQGQLKVILKELKVFERKRENDLSKLKHEKEAALRHIQEFRKQLNQLLDRLEKNIKQDLQQTVEKQSSSIKHQLSSLDSAIKSLETDLDKFNKAQQSGSSRTIFTAMERANQQQLRQLQHDIEQNSKYVEIHFQPDTKLQDLLKNLQCLGQICDNPMYVRGNYPDSNTAVPGTQNCLSADLRDRKISKVGEYKVSEDSDTATPDISGAVFLDDGRLIICDCKNNKVKLLSADLKLLSSLTLHSKPWDIVIISDSVVAVTLPDTLQLQYVTVSAQGLNTDRIQMIDRHCYGITRYNDRLYTTCTEPGEVLVLDLEGQVLHSCGGKDLFDRPWYITTIGDGLLYVSDSNTNTITCLSPDGKTVYSHNVESLKYPEHLLVDDDKYVYVCDYVSNNIQIITPAGELYRELINKEDGLYSSRCTAYRQSDMILVVGMSDNDQIKVYKFV